MREARFVLDQGPDPTPTQRAARRAGLLAEIAVLKAALPLAAGSGGAGCRSQGTYLLLL